MYEIGTNSPGEIGPLAELVQPTVAVLLNVHPAHIGNFADISELRKEKLSINKGLKDIANFVCEESVALAANLHSTCCIFGTERDADVRLLAVEGDRARYRTSLGELDARVPGGGEHRALTLAAVLGALILTEDAADAVERATDLPADLVPAGRGTEQTIIGPQGQHWVLVDDSYNANPASMAAALVALADATQSGYAVLGEMLELGAASDDLHAGLAELCAPLAGVLCVGEAMRPLYETLDPAQRLGFVATSAEIDTLTLRNRLPETARILVKGSNRVFWSHNWCERFAGVLGTTA